MQKRRLGIYLDPEGIAFAETEAKDLQISIFLPFSVLEQEALGSEPTSKSKIESLLQRGLRELNAGVSEAHIGLSEKEIIFRFLEMPSMKKSELELALPLEIEKYIPFKIDRIAWDYKDKKAFQEKKIKIAFAGMRWDLLRELITIFKEINLEMVSMESSSLSCIGALGYLNKIPKKIKHFAIFLISDDDGEIIIFSNNFPYFCRYIKFSKDGMGKPAITKIADELRMTLEYYRRESNRESLERLFLFGKQEHLDLFSSALGELEITQEPIQLEEVIKDRKLYSMQEFKAFSLALRGYRSPFLAFNFLKEYLKEKKEVSAEAALPVDIVETPWNFKPVLISIGLGLLLFIAILIHGTTQETSLLKQVREQERKMEEISLKGDLKDLKSLQKREAELTSLLAELNKNLDVPGDISSFINLLSENISDGMWFDEIAISRDPEFKETTLTIRGFVYLGSPVLERDSLNKFISGIKGSDAMKERKLNINLEGKRIREFDVTGFQVRTER